MRSNPLDTIVSKLQSLSEKKVTLGFDGFCDTILKVIRAKDEDRSTSYFESISEFGDYIIQKGEKNFSLELEETTTKIGGNMPIMANALAQFGPKQSCIGSLGVPTIHPVFNQMPSNCELYSFANPGLTNAMEFNGRKIILAEIGALNRIEWKELKSIIGLETIIRLFTAPDLVCLVNWSELDNSTNFWKGLLADVLPHVPHPSKKPIGFFDLSDCSKRTGASILEAIELLRSFSAYWNIVLSLNLNEAAIINNVLNHEKDSEGDIERIGSRLYEQLAISTVVVHYSKQALVWDSSGLHKKESFYVANPKLSTGAGDNFNAGFCAGMLMGLDAEISLLLGHATSGYYMTNGESPTISELFSLLSAKLNLPIPSTLQQATS